MQYEHIEEQSHAAKIRETAGTGEEKKQLQRTSHTQQLLTNIQEHRENRTRGKKSESIPDLAKRVYFYL